MPFFPDILQKQKTYPTEDKQVNVLFALNPQQLSVLIVLSTLFPTHYEDERTIQGLIQRGNVRHNVR